MCRPDSRVRLSAEDEIAAEESLSIYCKPVEFYNILQRRAIRNPCFLQRCLSYKIEAKHKRRIQMTVSLSRTDSEGQLSQNLFPLYVILARQVHSVTFSEYTATYRFSRACILNNSAVEGSSPVQANFVLPDINKLALEAKSGSVAILLISFANAGGYCLWGKIPLELLYISWENSPNFSLGQRAEMMSTIDMHPCFLKLNSLNEDKCFSIQFSYNTGATGTNPQLQVTVSAEEFGAREKSPYNSYLSGDIPSSSLSNIIGLRAGNVIFNYRYYDNKLQRTEVTEDFSCPFCLVKCASFKGMRYHLTSSHDLFNFEFWVTEDYQAVNVAVRTDNRSEIVADGVDPKLQVFFFHSKPLRRRRTKNLLHNAKHVHPYVLEYNLRAGACELSDKADDAQSSKGEKNLNSGYSSAILPPCADPGCSQSASGSNLAPPAMLQFAKTRKLSVERSDSRNCALLRKRSFFHSHKCQPMALEQVLSDRDSEDEVDDDVADFEDRRMLDDFVDVTKDEKQMMHMWNSFVRKQRVLADGHIPWACEAFSKLHGPDLVKNTSLLWCWRLFMIKLWNHGLLDARTMNNCNITFERFQKEASDPKE